MHTKVVIRYLTPRNWKLILVLLISTSCEAQSCQIDTLNKTSQSIDFVELVSGIEFLQMDAPKKSFLGDSKLTILRIDPTRFEFDLYAATANNKQKISAQELGDSLDYIVVFNAGMYELADGFTHRGYLKSGNHFNNKTLNPSYNSMLALSPTDTTHPHCKLIDLTCESWKTVQPKFSTFAQGPRMIDCNGEPMSWNKKKQSCSMLVASTDNEGKIYLIFSRSPYSHNEMISFLLQLPFPLTKTIYLEGGPETSLYIRTPKMTLSCIGSYVSETYPIDTNVDFWKLPNLIGLKQKIKEQ